MKYAILGPTGSGKTAYAISLAKRVNGAVISADSRQVYAGMNRGTAKPPEAWLDDPHAIDVPDMIEGIPHYLLNVATLDTPYTLSLWLAAAKETLVRITASGKTPIIAGGTMLYMDALTDGYDIPSIEPSPQLRLQLERQSAEELYTQLLEKDPAASAFIEPNNVRRVVRALEVIHATGKPFSSLRTKSASDNTWIRIGIFPGWDGLRENVSKRAKAMMTSGLEEEREALQKRFPTSSLLQTMNYTENTVQEMTQSNMRYARRQMSWWKRRSDIGWICLE